MTTKVIKVIEAASSEETIRAFYFISEDNNPITQQQLIDAFSDYLELDPKRNPYDPACN